MQEPAHEMSVPLILLALLSLRGQHPAQETICFEAGKADMSAPISERIRIAISGSLLSTGVVRISSSETA